MAIKGWLRERQGLALCTRGRTVTKHGRWQGDGGMELLRELRSVYVLPGRAFAIPKGRALAKTSDR